MNNYPTWWDKTITIFNRYEDPLTDLVTWYKTIISGCFWKYVGEKIAINNAILETNNIVCRIPIQENFLEKYEWVEVPNDEMNNYFTLGIGDIIVLGEADDDIDEYITGKRSSDIKAKYKALQGCMVIEKAALNLGGGRNDEHYYVKGI